MNSLTDGAKRNNYFWGYQHTIVALLQEHKATVAEGSFRSHNPIIWSNTAHISHFIIMKYLQILVLYQQTSLYLFRY